MFMQNILELRLFLQPAIDVWKQFEFASDNELTESKLPLSQLGCHDVESEMTNDTLPEVSAVSLYNSN
jgi:hypothetical protein